MAGGMCGWGGMRAGDGHWSGWYASYWNAFLLPPATKLGQGNIFRSVCHNSVHGGVCVVAGGHVWFYSGGVRGFIRGACVFLFGGACVVLFGGHVWFYSGGHAWFYSAGGACVVLFSRGGMRGFIQRRACVVLFSRGGVRGFFSFSDTMRYGQWAGGNHPTGMHSCYSYNGIKVDTPTDTHCVSYVGHELIRECLVWSPEYVWHDDGLYLVICTGLCVDGVQITASRSLREELYIMPKWKRIAYNFSVPNFVPIRTGASKVHKA